MGVNRDDVDDLLAAWALDAVDDLERDAVEAVLAADPDRARVARTLQHTVAAIGDVVAESPPPDVRANLLRAVAARRVAVTLVADVDDYCRTAARRIDIDELAAVIEGDREQAHALLTAARLLAV